jgi:Spy/CpxP family protein refolding chaperone
MRKLVLAAMAAAIVSVPLAATVKAEDTTVIHKSDGYGDHKTIIKKHEDRTMMAPREERKVIIHHDY